MSANSQHPAPMLQMNGKVLNVFKAPDFTDKETGQTKPGSHKVQLLVQNLQKNGEWKMDMVNLSTDSPDFFQARQGQDVSLPVGAFPNGKDVQFYVIKAALELYKAKDKAKEDILLKK